MKSPITHLNLTQMKEKKNKEDKYYRRSKGCI